MTYTPTKRKLASAIIRGATMCQYPDYGRYAKFDLTPLLVNVGSVRALRWWRIKYNPVGDKFDLRVTHWLFDEGTPDARWMWCVDIIGEA